ncbi:MAG: leucine-rich repeat protein, partial [Paludibacteraceae bacterium]|nr:leucine-rich repeat protein [Paludibacteraceae bacterium]
SFSSGNAIITNVATNTRTIRWNKNSGQERFACYENNGQQPVQLYKAGGGGGGTTYSAYTTTCGPNIKAAAVERLTSTKNQTVKSQALTVKGGSLDGNTLTATITGTDAAQFTCALAATTITAGAIETTYTISYTPTVFGTTHEATLTFTDGTTSSESITLRGRSLPEQFAIVAYDGANYYVLDGAMSGTASTVRPLPVTVTNGAVDVCPSRAVYSLTQLNTPDENVYLVSNGQRLWGGSDTKLNMKSLTSTSGTNWLLTTSDFVTYHITNATNTGRGVMYSGVNNVFGHYAISNYGTANYYGDLRLLPIGSMCTCLDAPQPTVLAQSTSATVSWPALSGAASYVVTCSAGSVSVSDLTATITGLSSNTTYTYTVKAVASGTDCSQTYNGSFTTTVCDDVPYDVAVTPIVNMAIVRWKADADKATVRIYSDAACTSEVTSKANMQSGDTITGLAESQSYYLKVFAGSDQTCASTAVEFGTLTTSVEIVEWHTDGVDILLTGDEMTATILVEDKQENTSTTTTNYADSLFISKYFEADSENKLVALYNGTKDTIKLSNYCLKRSQKGTNPNELVMELGSYGRVKSGYIAPNEEIIFIRYSQQADKSAEECASEQEGYENWYEFAYNSTEGNFLNFSGPMSIGLYSKTANKFIDVVGATTNASGTGNLCQINASNSVSCTDAEKDFNDAAGFYTLAGDNYQTEEVETDYGLSTNRCLLIRKNTVKSGLNAVANNVHSLWLDCSEGIAQAFTTLSSEWAGLQIGAGSSGGETHSYTCIGMGNVGGFDYQGYYAQFDSVAFVENVINNKNEDGTITIPVPGLDTMSCSMMRIKVYEGGVEKATTEKRVPIMIHAGEIKTTDELFTKHDAAACAECDVVVFNGATLQKGEAASGRNAIHDLTLYPGSTLDLPSGKGNYSVNSIIYRVEGDNVPVTKLNGDLLTESKKLIVTRRITNDRYYFISLPYNCNMADIQLSNGTPATNGVDFRLLEYDAETRAQEGSLQGAPGHWKLATGDVLEAGKGYAIAVSSKKPKEIVFPMTLPSSNLTYEERTKVTNTVDINEYVGAARSTNYNWNLIAHPYITKFEVTSGAANVEAYWEEPHRYNTDWIDEWKTWPEEDPTQGTDSTETHTGEIVESGTTEGGIVWVLYADGSIELTGGGQMADFSAPDAVPWAQHRQLIQNVKIGGDVQKIGKYAFGQCTNLTNVIIAAPVTNLASQAFAGCTGLRTFRIESTQYVSATTTTFDGISSLTMISLYVPQSMYSQYSAQTPWSKMAISAFDDNSTTGGQTSGDGTNTTNPSPRRAPVHDGWTESPGGIYVTIPVFRGGKVDYDQYWINEVADIKPFTAVFIQGDGQGEMTFNMYPSSPAPKRMLQAAPCETRDHTVFVGLTINGNGQKDKTSLRLRPDFTEEYKFNLDLLKFTVFNTARPQIYFKTPNEQLAFRAVSDSLAANTWLPVGVYCRDAGEYTFSLHDRYVWDEVEAVYLRDNVTGVETNLLIGNYTITTTGQIYTNTRFAVKVLLRRKQVVETPTMIDHTEDPNAPRKFFRDGLLYILRDGKVYDMTGKPVEFDDLLNR